MSEQGMKRIKNLNKRSPKFRGALFAQGRFNDLNERSVLTIDYLLSRSLPRDVAKTALQQLLELFEIAPVNRSVLEEALQSRMTDFEDAVLSHAANLVGATAIVTRNTKDFRHSPIKAIDPAEFLSVFE